jgi:two-component system cell cycle sensor histidine kinase/response regulator CckA
VLLTDVLMPRVAGPELAQGVARLRPGTPVVYLSGYTASRLGEDGILQPDVAFLQKPVSQDDLMDALAKAIATAAKPSRRRTEA